jgi:hypothetical protein
MYENLKKTTYLTNRVLIDGNDAFKQHAEGSSYDVTSLFKHLLQGLTTTTDVS